MSEEVIVFAVVGATDDCFYEGLAICEMLPLPSRDTAIEAHVYLTCHRKVIGAEALVGAVYWVPMTHVFDNYEKAVVFARLLLQDHIVILQHLFAVLPEPVRAGLTAAERLMDTP